MTNNKYITDWVKEMAAMTKPDNIVWIDGSEEQAEALRKEACSTGEMIKLNEELLPMSHVSRTEPSSAPKQKRTPATSTTGWIRPNAMQS